MSVTLLLQAFEGAPSRLLPISTQERFVSSWMPAVEELGLEWIGLAVTGFFITPENREEVVLELKRLREWLAARSEVHAAERIDPVVAEIQQFQFENGANAYLG